MKRLPFAQLMISFIMQLMIFLIMLLIIIIPLLLPNGAFGDLCILPNEHFSKSALDHIWEYGFRGLYYYANQKRAYGRVA